MAVEEFTPLRRILLVDDTIEIRAMLGIAFSRMPECDGWQVSLAGGAEEALRKLRDATNSGYLYDLLVTDIAMPDKSGLVMVKELRAEGDQIPVIFHSAFDGVINHQEAEDLGAIDYISKPTNIREMVARIKTAMKWEAPSPASA